MINQKLLLLLVCVAVSLGMACSPATPPHPQKSSVHPEPDGSIAF